MLRIVSKFGWIGVDVFFVLSGFLITNILKDSDRVDYFRRFWQNRVVRILPAYYLFVFIAIAFNWLDLFPVEQSSQMPSLLSLFTFTTNIETFFEGHHPLRPFSVLWSIDIEQHFYLLWPFLFLIFRRELIPTLISSVVVIFLFGRILAYTSGYGEVSIYVMTVTHCDGLLLGGLYAVLRDSPKPKIFTQIAIVLVGCVLVLVVSAQLIGGDIPLQASKYTIVPMACVALLHFSLSNARLGYALTRPPMLILGKYSYSFYLWHFTILILTREALFPLMENRDLVQYALIVGIAAFIVTLLLCRLVWEFVEEPFLRMKYRSTPARLSEKSGPKVPQGD